MDLFTCEVRLAGSVQNTVYKREVTAAEVDVLRAIHGEDAVVSIELCGTTNAGSATAERERLVSKYNPQVVFELFPGARPNLPTTAAEIGVVAEDEKPKSKRRTAAKPLEPVVTAELDD